MSFIDFETYWRASETISANGHCVEPYISDSNRPIFIIFGSLHCWDLALYTARKSLKSKDIEGDIYGLNLEVYTYWRASETINANGHCVEPYISDSNRPIFIIFGSLHCWDLALYTARKSLKSEDVKGDIYGLDLEVYTYWRASETISANGQT